MSNKTDTTDMTHEPQRTIVPRLRFPEFRDAGAWINSFLGGISTVTSGGTPNRSNKEFWSGNIPWVTTSLIDFNTIFKTNEHISEIGLQESSAKLFPQNTILMAMYGQGKTRGKVAILGIEATTNQACAAILLNKGLHTNFVFQNLASRYDEIRELSNAGGQENLSAGLIENIPFSYPENKEEQRRIADCLASIDALIAAQAQKLAALKAHKSGLMQQLFPAAGATVPRLRFPEFRDAGAWEGKNLDCLLDYQQPAEYLVSDTNYSDAYKTPVLTAGKTFILGYTNEQHGIFSENLPVIIFDDFTTATQFVDFPFKAKSSAMKILQARKGVHIKFMYEALQMISYEVGVHERHWISKFVPMSVLVPSHKEQQRIADCLASIDALIAGQAQKLAALKVHKHGLMQQLFPAAGEVQA